MIEASYLHHNLVEDFKGSKDDRILAFEVKTRDRLHNLHTVGIKTVKKQADYVAETSDIVAVGQGIRKKLCDVEVLEADIQSLSRASLTLSDRLLDNHRPELEATNSHLVLLQERDRIRQRLKIPLPGIESVH